MSRKNLFLIVLAILSLLVIFKYRKYESNYVVVDKCKEVEAKVGCWSSLLNEILDKKGLPATFDKLAELYETEPAFASECHTFAHEIGKAASEKFEKGDDLDINSKTSYCGYGFFHGFMETLLQKTGDIKKAQDFCHYIGLKLRKDTIDGEGACYHGIGHGTVDGDEPEDWGNPQKIISPGLNMCERVAGDEREPFGKLYRCVSGAYNSLEILSLDPKYKLSIISNNPFYICPAQKIEYQEACYTNMLPALLRLTYNDLLKSQSYVEKIKENGYEIRSSVTSSLFHEFIRLNLNKPNYSIGEGIKLCRKVSDSLRLSCIGGLSGGHMKYGDPKTSYIKGLEFCANEDLFQDEREDCYNYILSRLRNWYSVSKSKEICESVPKEYKKYCHYE